MVKDITSVVIYYSSGEKDTHRLGQKIFGVDKIHSIIADAGGSVISVGMFDENMNLLKRTYCRELDIYY